jgi:hypothetical protein
VVENNASQLAEKLSAKVNKDKKYRKFGGIYMASLLCGIPRVISDLSLKTGRSVLLADVLEDACEARLKPAKRLEAQSNFRNYCGLFGRIVDNLLADVQQTSSACSSHTWTGEGVKEIRFAPCWLIPNAVASHNVVEAISLALEDSGLQLCHFISLFTIGGCNGGIRVIVGTEGETVSLCGCGTPGHRLEIDNVCEFILFSRYFYELKQSDESVMSILRKAFQSVVPSDAPDVTPNAIKEALVAAERNRVVRVKEETRVARVECVRLLLVRLEWLCDGEPIDNDALRWFRIPQDPSKFVAHEWPMGIHN